MDLDQSPLLHEPDLMLAVLRVANTGSGTLDDCLEHLRQLRRIAQVDDEPMPEAEVRSGLETARAKLRRAGLVEIGVAGRTRITTRGRRVLAAHPTGIDDSVLMRLAEPKRINGDGAAVPASRPAASVDYQGGYRAFLAGAGPAENPHARGARAHLDWDAGWSQARADHEIT